MKNKKSECFDWYPEIVQNARLADYAPVHGCMVIRDRGYGMWEQIQSHFD